MVLLFELTICRKALGKKFFFAMWSLGRGRRGSGQNLARAGGGVGLGRARGDLGVARDRFGSTSGVEMAGGEACGGGSRGTPVSGKVEAGDNGWGGSTACVGARGGEGVLFGLASGL
jgi:hypothetical protein